MNNTQLTIKNTLSKKGEKSLNKKILVEDDYHKYFYLKKQDPMIIKLQNKILKINEDQIQKKEIFIIKFVQNENQLTLALLQILNPKIDQNLLKEIRLGCQYHELPSDIKIDDIILSRFYLHQSQLKNSFLKKYLTYFKSSKQGLFVSENNFFILKFNFHQPWFLDLYFVSKNDLLKIQENFTWKFFFKENSFLKLKKENIDVKISSMELEYEQLFNNFHSELLKLIKLKKIKFLENLKRQITQKIIEKKKLKEIYKENNAKIDVFQNQFTKYKNQISQNTNDIQHISSILSFYSDLQSLLLKREKIQIRKKENTIQKSICQFCCLYEINIVFLPCNHCIICNKCFSLFQQEENNQCFLCFTLINGTIEIKHD